MKKHANMSCLGTTPSVLAALLPLLLWYGGGLKLEGKRHLRLTHTSNIIQVDTDMFYFLSAENTLVLKPMILYEKSPPRTMAMTPKSQARSLFRWHIRLLHHVDMWFHFLDYGLDID